eukprot:m.102768 g.102768  ORF g.102768 m.102768 type:complete len:689 (-) comp12550_c0_seq2:128-2194(-)
MISRLALVQCVFFAALSHNQDVTEARGFGGTGASAGSKPNIVFILADDLGWNNIGHHNGVTRSPNIDALYTEGLTLNHSYSHKWCAPTRAALMTGRLPYHTGIEHGNLGSYDAPEFLLALSAEWTFLPATLKAAGYSTHMLGKWNLGHWAEWYMPTHRGFDSYLGYLSADEQYYTHYKWPPYSGGAGSLGYTASLPSLYNITDLTNGTGKATAEYDGVYSTYMYAAEARRIIAAAADRNAAAPHAEGGAPFFLYLAAQSIHTPLEAPDEYMALYPDAPDERNNSDARVIHAMVTALDDLVGNVTGALKSGNLWANTLVVFTADNGGDTHGNNYPLRGGKFTTWEGGLRVVGAVSGGALPASCDGGVADGLVHICDWHATFAHLAGVTINATGPRPLDSINVWPHLASCGAQPSPRTALLHHYDGPTQGAYREGDLKLIIGSMTPFCWDAAYPLEPSKHCTPGTGDPHPRDWACSPCKSEGPQPCPSESPCLFNVSSQADPLEKTNIAVEHPEIVKAMVAKYNALGADTCTPHLGSCLDYIGVADEPKLVAQTVASMHVGPLPNAGDPHPAAPTTPPPPPTAPTAPPPPVSPQALAGRWALDDGGGVVVVTAAGPTAIRVSTTAAKSCWDAGTGTVEGSVINLNATSAACTRFGVGTVSAADAAALQVKWVCSKPGGASCSWPGWSKAP